MKKLEYLSCDEIEELKKIIYGKQRTTRERLINLIGRIKIKYDFYLKDFSNIQNISNNDFDAQESKDLQGCYAIDTLAKEALVKSIIMAQTIHFQDICAYCLINTRSTIDHYIPEKSFPVYSVLAKNLIPCCAICNQKKLEYWREKNKRAIIHFYYDLNLQVQFLFCSMFIDERCIPHITFELRNDNNISAEDYFIIRKHFERLDLINRYHEKIDLVISDLREDILINRLELGVFVSNDMINKILKRKADKLKENFGVNYWKALAIEILADSEIFLNSIDCNS